MESTIRILHLEDDHKDAELIASMITAEGLAADIIHVETKENFIKELDRGDFDIILSDYTIPSYDGISALRAAREKCPGIPFIFVSGTIGEERAIEALLEGAVDYVLKNNMKRLIPAVYRALHEVEEISLRKQAEKSLKISEQQYRSIVENTADWIWEIDLNGKHTYSNRHVESVLGYSVSELIGRSSFDFMADEDRDSTQRKFSGLMASKQGWKNWVIRRCHKDGSCHYLESTAEPIINENGELQGYRGVDRDITERKRLEETLVKNEEKYRNIFENAVEGIYQSIPDGCFTAVNPAMARMHGFTSPEEMLISITDINKQMFADPEDRTMYRKILEEKGEVKGFEARIYRKDGDTIWVSINARVVKGCTGNVSCFEGTTENITARKFAEESLQQAMAKLRKSLIGTIRAISLTVERRDPYTAGHQKNVSKLARRIAQQIGFPNDTIDAIRMAGAIHDIGKVSVPAEILSKPGVLTDIEFSLIKVHPQTGYDILKDVDLPYPIAEVVLQHHERLNGSGYPRGLKDGQILLESQIISVADVVEAISSHRPYRAALGIDVALEEIEKNTGILYDANAVAACLRLFREEGFTFE